MPWRRIDKPLFQWVPTVDRILSSADPLSFDGPSIVIASDYGGTDKKSRYRVNVYLCLDLEASEEWEIRRKWGRRRYIGDSRRMSFKRLSDIKRSSALVPFLSAAETIRGICVVIISNKAVRDVPFDRDDYKRLRDEACLQAKWKDKDLVEAFRTAHFVAYLVGGLSRPNQNIYWISDEDVIFSNATHSRDVARLLSSFSSHYVPHGLGELGVGTTALDQGDLFEEDLAAVADLVAGGIAEGVNKLSRSCGGRIPAHLAIEHPGKFCRKPISLPIGSGWEMAHFVVSQYFLNNSPKGNLAYRSMRWQRVKRKGYLYIHRMNSLVIN